MSDGAIYGESAERESSTDNWASSDLDSKANNQKRSSSRDSYKGRRFRDNVNKARGRDSRQATIKSKSKDVPLYDESSFKHRLQADVSPDKGVFPTRAIKDIRRYEGISRTQSDPRLRDLCREEFHRRSNSDKNGLLSRVDSEKTFYHSSSSSVISDKKSPGQSDYPSSHPFGSHRYHPSPSNTSSYQVSEGKVGNLTMLEITGQRTLSQIRYFTKHFSIFIVPPSIVIKCNTCKFVKHHSK